MATGEVGEEPNPFRNRNEVAEVNGPERVGIDRGGYRDIHLRFIIEGYIAGPHDGHCAHRHYFFEEFFMNNAARIAARCR